MPEKRQMENTDLTVDACSIEVQKHEHLCTAFESGLFSGIRYYMHKLNIEECTGLIPESEGQKSLLQNTEYTQMDLNSGAAYFVQKSLYPHWQII